MAGLAAGVGCVHTDRMTGAPDGPPIAVPPPGAVPRELDKIVLPPYVIEAPDILLIQVFQRARVPVKIGGPNGPVPPAIPPADHPAAAPDDKDVPTREEAQPLPLQDVSGQFVVRPDGSVSLGLWGSVTVAGLSLDQAAAAIRTHLLATDLLGREYRVQPQNLIVIVDVLAYNSKRYYVVLDGGGYGEQVYPFPVTGSETVMDAVANVNGLHAVASKRNIWVARRTPHCGQPWQILPVDWVGITQHGITVTNYQIMPGDRVYVKAQRLVTIDTALARVLTPIERVFGVTLLGTSMINQINGRNVNRSNTGF
ncbi:MAG: polysaccharide biosynthesis/export family protein [Gemmataceae bacterium]|nr:polysaccharide biosynthesis/export family protein [Gemmataceae bacterium]